MLIDYCLISRPEESSLRLGRAEAALRLAELRRLERLDDWRAESDAILSMVSGLLAEHAGLPRILIAETEQRIALEDSREHLEQSVVVLHRQAFTDPTTGISNRRAVDSRLDELRAGEPQPVGVIVVDLDRFKAINDTVGHIEGDRVLATVGELMSGVLEPTDTLARLGGDEFIAVLTGESPVHAFQIGEAICAAIADFDWNLLGVSAALRCSVGVAHGTANNVDDLVRQADQAMYEAKRSGRNRVAMFGSTTDR